MEDDFLTIQDYHIVACLKEIVQQHLPQDEYIIISLPPFEKSWSPERVLRRSNSYSVAKDIAQVFIKELAGIYRIVVLLEPNEMLVNNIWYQSLSQTFVIAFWPNWNNIQLILDSLSPTLDLHLIVVLRMPYNCMSVPKIVQDLAALKVFNLLVLIPCESVASTHFNSISISKEKAISLCIYSWYPYEPINNCGEFKNVVKIDEWLLEGHGRFLQNVNLFPKKSPINFEKCVFIFDILTSSKFKTPSISGVSYLTLFLEYLIIGLFINKLNLTAIHTSMNTKVTIPDVIIRSPPLNVLNFAEYEMNNLTAAQPYQVTETKWFVPCPHPFIQHGKFYKVFSYPLWIIIIALTLLIAFTIHLLIKIANAYENKSEIYVTNIVHILLIMWGALLGEGVKIRPVNYVFRTIVLSWILFSFMISIVFQSFFTSFLIEPGMEKAISNLKELMSSNVNLRAPEIEYDIWNDTFKEYNMTVKTDRMFNEQMYFEEYRRYQNFAFVGDVSYANFYCPPVHKYQAHRCCNIDDQTITVYYSFLIPRSSFFRDLFPMVLFRVVESGLVNENKRMIHEHPGFQKQEWRTVSVSKFPLPSEEYFTFSLKHVQVMIYLLITGYTVSVIAFIVENKLYSRWN
ncbi:Ionotropic receptor 677 [Blattella germanica]|nr:Ionotropic receptor 677 [Blattella germanica]